MYLPDHRIVDGPYSPRGLFPADKNNVGPRIRLAFRPFADNRAAIRMGYGIFYTMVDGQATRQLERNPPVAAVVDLRTEQDGNLFNRVNLGFPGSPVRTPGYGIIQSAVRISLYFLC